MHENVVEQKRQVARVEAQKKNVGHDGDGKASEHNKQLRAQGHVLPRWTQSQIEQTKVNSGT